MFIIFIIALPTFFDGTVERWYVLMALINHTHTHNKQLFYKTNLNEMKKNQKKKNFCKYLDSNFSEAVIFNETQLTEENVFSYFIRLNLHRDDALSA